jgi:histidine ammonia-lyase
MGMTAALKARQVAEHVRYVLAIELLVASQALDFRAPVKPGKGARAAHELIRSRVPHMDADRELHKDIAAVAALIDSGEILSTVRRATA